MRSVFCLTVAFFSLITVMPLFAAPEDSGTQFGVSDPDWYRKFVPDYASLISERLPYRNRYGRGGEKQFVGFRSRENTCTGKSSSCSGRKRVKVSSPRIRIVSGKCRNTKCVSVVSVRRCCSSK